MFDIDTRKTTELEPAEEETMAADISTRFHQLAAMPVLEDVVRSSCSQLNIPLMKLPVPPSRPTNVEEKFISQKAFGDEFKFTVDVNLVDSKAAFNLLVDGLDSSNDFLGLWKLNDSDPHKHPHPISDRDISVLNRKQKRAEEKPTDEEAQPPSAKQVKIDSPKCNKTGH